MLGPVDYALWVLSFGAELYVLALALIRRNFLPYLTLNIYLLATALVTVGQYLVIRHYGFASLEYRFYYYYSDSVLSVFMYLAVVGFYQHVFREMRVSRYIQTLATFILVSTAGLSFLVIRQAQNNLTGRFVVELARNLYFLGVILTYLLWAALVKLRQASVRVVQLVLSLGVFFGASAAIYGLRYLFPSLEVWKVIPPILGCWLPVSWAYTFTKVPEEARLAPARIAALHR